MAPNFFDGIAALQAHEKGAGCYNLGCHQDCWGMRSEDSSDVAWMEVWFSFPLTVCLVFFDKREEQAGNMGVMYTRHFYDQLSLNIHRLLPLFSISFGFTLNSQPNMNEAGIARRWESGTSTCTPCRKLGFYPFPA